jgi:hypothetical protein
VGGGRIARGLGVPPSVVSRRRGGSGALRGCSSGLGGAGERVWGVALGRAGCSTHLVLPAGWGRPPQPPSRGGKGGGQAGWAGGHRVIGVCGGGGAGPGGGPLWFFDDGGSGRGGGRSAATPVGSGTCESPDRCRVARGVVGSVSRGPQMRPAREWVQVANAVRTG